MNIIIRTGFEKVTYDILFQPETMPKGKKLCEANHVLYVEEHRSNGVSLLIQAQVIRQTSVSSPPYMTKLHINAARHVVKVSCTCIYNQSGKCKHIAALIHYINSDNSYSKTDFEQQWGKPTARQFSQDKYSKGKYFFEMYPSKQKGKNVETYFFSVSELKRPSALKLVMVEMEKDKNERIVKNLIDSLLKTVEMNLEKENCEECLNFFSSLVEKKPLYTQHPIVKTELQDFYEKNITMSSCEIVQLCCDTLEQSKCDKWFRARNVRISASKDAHSIKCRIKKSIESLIEEMLFPKRVDTSSLKYGIQHEKDACKEYEKLFNTTVKKVGVIVSEKQPWMCANLDGVVFLNNQIIKIVEFKCPSSCEKQKVVDYTSKKCNVNYLIFKDDIVKLKESSLYYTQCQMQMYISGMDVCDLFVYCPLAGASVCISVDRNERFLQTVINKCESFYFYSYLPELSKKITEKYCNNNLVGKEQVKRCFTGQDIINKLKN